MDKVKVSPKFQMVIPRGLRERQKIRVGQELSVLDQGFGFMVLPDVDLKDMEGAIPGLSLDGIREEEDRF